HYIDNEVIGNRKFKITSFNNLELCTLKQYAEKGILPYIKNYAESDLEILDVNNYMKSSVKNYLSMNDQNMQQHFDYFSAYLEQYLVHINKAFKEGFFVLDPQGLEQELEEVLSRVSTSSSVAKHIYQNINIIGAVDYFDTKKGESRIPDSRKLTIVNPIRLIAYLKRFETLNQFVQKWCEYATQGNLEVEKLEEYLEFAYSKVSHLAPRYFSVLEDDTYLIENDEYFGEGSFV
ncbi:hypothetical protein RB298_00470, partial [Priestia sp. BR_2]